MPALAKRIESIRVDTTYMNAHQGNHKHLTIVCDNCDVLKGKILCE